jgi:RHS repeat-associated protein
VIKRVDYDSFGNIIEDTDSIFEVPFGFAGGLHDRDTGLVRFGYRDYDPGVGRWTAKDPIFFAGGDIDLYGYCLNNPINLIDPEGLWHIDVGISGSATGALGPGGTIGFKFGPTGVYFYYGFGLGVGAGASATINTGNPCEEVSVTGTLRGGIPIGGVPVGSQVSVSIGQKSGVSESVGAGLGLGVGASLTATHTIKLF